MLSYGLLLLLFVVRAEFVVQNMTCPEVSPRELDLKGLDGEWYLAAAATDLPVYEACAKVIFSHKNANSTDVSFSSVVNNTNVYYNGSVNLIPEPDTNDKGDLLSVNFTDGVNRTFSFLDINYEHYAVIFTCNNNTGNSSTYELFKLSRTLHIKEDSEAKIDTAIAKYNLQNTSFVIFNNTDATCKTSGSDHIAPSLLLTSVAALTLFRRFY